MQRLGPFNEAHLKVLNDAKRSLDTIRRLSSLPCESTEASIDVLQRLRQEAYEDLNQIQHEHLIVRAAEWLCEQRGICNEVVWLWNPRQTGDSSEPDLRAMHFDIVQISAEVTASKLPNGSIDSRMQKTLAKLAQMDGAKFYFVRTEEMRQRATTKVAKRGWAIQVVRLSAV